MSKVEMKLDFQKFNFILLHEALKCQLFQMFQKSIFMIFEVFVC